MTPNDNLPTTQSFESTQALAAALDAARNAGNDLDVLDKDLTGVEVDPPLLKGGIILFTIKSVKVEQTKAQDSNKLVIELVTVTDNPSNKGTVLPAGRRLTHNISLKRTSSEGKDIGEIVDRNLAAFKLACTGTKDGSMKPLEQFIGKQVAANVLITKDAEGRYAPKNEISRFVPLKVAGTDKPTGAL